MTRMNDAEVIATIREIAAEKAKDTLDNDDMARLLGLACDVIEQDVLAGIPYWKEIPIFLAAARPWAEAHVEDACNRRAEQNYAEFGEDTDETE